MKAFGIGISELTDLVNDRITCHNTKPPGIVAGNRGFKVSFGCQKQKANRVCKRSLTISSLDVTVEESILADTFVGPAGLNDEPLFQGIGASLRYR